MQSRLFISAVLLVALLAACQPHSPLGRADRKSGQDPEGVETVVYRGQAIRVDARIPYAHPGGVRLGLDVYRPAGRERLPSVLDIHGGGWETGNKEEATLPPVELAARGFVVFVPDYRLACKDSSRPLCGYGFRAPVEDMRSALLWVRRHGDRFHAITHHVAAAGTSAGGHLAQMLGVSGRKGGTRADAVVSWSGPSTLQLLAKSRETRSTVTEYVGCKLTRCPRRWKQASPITHVTDSSAPMLLINSENDPIVPAKGARRMARALREHGVPVELHVPSGRVHAAFGPEALRGAAHWLHAHL